MPIKFISLPLLSIIFFSFFISCKKTETGKLNLPPDSANPNVILIVGDDVGYEIPTCDGGQSYSTPNIDSLAYNGMRFTQCYSAPLCSPSRIMLLTGKYNFRNYYNWGVLNKDQLTLGNMLKNNGYETYYAGKWQLDGGDASIKKFGFDDYTVWLPYNIPEVQAGSRYKSPVLYNNGNYISPDKLNNKYGEDVFTDSIKSFILKNEQKKFFIYYAMVLTHIPFSPTPDDNDYRSWDASNVQKSNTKYFPGMVNYMDKKIGQLMQFLNKQNLDKNTVIIYIGDNGTPIQIQSRFNGTTITGGKGSTITYGTHVPCIFYWPGTIAPGSVNNNLVCFPDFLPTLAALTHSPIPGAFYPVDGVSFYDQFFGNNSVARKSIFCSYRYDTILDINPARWVQDTHYKLYDTLENNYHLPGFYDMQNNIEETDPLSDAYLTSQQQAIKQNFSYVLDSLK